jgi:membrane-associated protein
MEISFMSGAEIYSLLITYKYVALFPVAVLEGPLATLVAGVFVALGHMNAWIVYIIMVLGDMVGDTGFYLLGRYGSNNVRTWAMRFFKIDIEKVGVYFSDNPKKTLVLAKVIHGIGLSGIMGAGVVKFPYTRFVVTCAFVSLIQVGILLMVGIFFGGSYVVIEQYLGYASAIISTAVLIGATWWYIAKGKETTK